MNQKKEPDRSREHEPLHVLDAMEYRLICLNRREWFQLQDAANQSGQSVGAYLAVRERVDDVSIRDLTLGEGKLVMSFIVTN